MGQNFCVGFEIMVFYFNKSGKYYSYHLARQQLYPPPKLDDEKNNSNLPDMGYEIERKRNIPLENKYHICNPWTEIDRHQDYAPT